MALTGEDNTKLAVTGTGDVERVNILKVILITGSVVMLTYY